MGQTCEPQSEDGHTWGVDIVERSGRNGGATVELPADMHAPGLARDFVFQHRDDLPPEMVDDARLLASELATNAVRYGRAAITLSMSSSPPGAASGPGVEIAVHDEGADLPVVPATQPESLAQSGRGLLIVAALATAWGIEVSSPPPGKTVWFEL